MMTDVNKALMKKAEQIAYGTELLMAKTRDWQVIKAYLSNRLAEFELTEEQQKKLKRYQFIYDQLSSGKYTDPEVVNQVIKLHGVNQAQAYEDMSCTREIFNSVININKRFEVNLQLQINRNMMRKCEELGDMKAAAALEKNRALLLKLLPDEEDNPAELFQGHIIDAVFDPRLLGAPDVDMNEVLRVVNEKRDKKIKIDMFEELLYEDVTDDPIS
jgi:RNase P subunit RPR2